MLKCKNCGRDVGYNGGICVICGAALSISQEDIDAARHSLALPEVLNSPERLLAVRELLAAAGDTESEYEWGRYLERAVGIGRNFDEAMKYYSRAARSYHPQAAYRYSRLVRRTNESVGIFWLKMSALFGCTEAYFPLGEHLCSAGDFSRAVYYYNLAAEGGEPDAIVALAECYAEGRGVNRSEPFARWELDRFKVPPISALKLAYTLANVKAEKPLALKFPDFDEYIEPLAKEALGWGFESAYYYLVSLLADGGSLPYMLIKGKLLAEGRGTAQDSAAALSILDTAAGAGSLEAYMYIARAYIKGDSFLKQDIERGSEYLRLAAAMGEGDAYEVLGDIYMDSRLMPEGRADIKLAFACYELGMDNGSAGARAKHDEILKRRQDYYNAGIATLSREGSVTRREASEAYRSLVLATAYGHPSAPRALAKCYAYGFGTERNTREAFRNFRLAYEGGDAEAALSLGQCYMRGFGVGFDYKKAVRYLNEAALLGFEEAKEGINLLNRRRMMSAVRGLYSTIMRLIYQKKWDTAFDMLTSFADIGYPKAIYTLGLCHEFGVGTRCDMAAAQEYYRRAALGSAGMGAFIDEGAKYKSAFLRVIKSNQ